MIATVVVVVNKVCDGQDIQQDPSLLRIRNLRDVGSQTIKDPIIVFHSEAIRYPVAHHLVTGDVGI